jgi:hypothetical protein
VKRDPRAPDQIIIFPGVRIKPRPAAKPKKARRKKQKTAVVPCIGRSLMKITPYIPMGVLAIALLLPVKGDARADDAPRCVVGEQSCMAAPGTPEWNAWDCDTRRDKSTCEVDPVQCQWDAATSVCMAKP